jgi:hypothetical protein
MYIVFTVSIWSERGCQRKDVSYNIPGQLTDRESFTPPDFGVTILGASHGELFIFFINSNFFFTKKGFDPKGSTSGFILWVYGVGIMVDPPPFAMRYLKMRGISSVLIKAIIISHCHADHDSGAFHKVLDHNKIEVNLFLFIKLSNI